MLALRRSPASPFAPGFVVFPGGVVEPADEALAARLFGDPAESARACALRELYEEAGLLLTAEGMVSGSRRPLVELSFEPPSADALVEMARWVAPEALEVRFDARFFATGAPSGLEPVADGVEIERAWWGRPDEVLAEARRGDASLMWPTLVTLEELAGCRTVAEVLSLWVEQVPRPGTGGGRR